MKILYVIKDVYSKEYYTDGSEFYTHSGLYRKLNKFEPNFDDSIQYETIELAEEVIKKIGFGTYEIVKIYTF